MKSLIELVDLYKDRTFLVCGMGRSVLNPEILSEINNRERFVTMGVNDIERIFTPDCMVFVDQLEPIETTFPDRAYWVKHTEAKHVFSQNYFQGEGELHKERFVKFVLGHQGQLDLMKTAPVVGHGLTSVYVAVQIAYFLGAKRIGIAGLDLEPGRACGLDGMHPLQPRLNRLNGLFLDLWEALSEKGTEIFTLVPDSKIKIPFIPLAKL